jgi:UDP-glucose 4-epimerase
VYAGSHPAPFDERSVPRPISEYGRTKLEQEQLLESFAASLGVRAAVGRISNLYGPGQDLAKGQGLVSQLCRTHLLGQPLQVYVPFDTIRDYVFAPDCGRMVVRLLDAVSVSAPAGSCTLKVLASQQGTTVGSILREFQRVVKRPPRVVQRASPLGALQVPDLRLRSVVLPEVDELARTPLPAGLNATWTDLLGRFGRGALRAG